MEKPSPSSPTSVLGVESEEDLYTKLKHLQRELEFVQIQEEYVKDEQKNLKIELLRAQEEVKRIQAVPLVIGQFLEMVDENAGIVSSTTGSNYYVRILSTLNRELLKPSSSVALHRHSNALVDILPPEADSSISLLTDAERPDVKYSDVGGMDVQKQVRVAGLSQIQTPFDMLCRVQLRKSYYYNKCTRVQHCSARVRPTVYSYKSRSRLTFFLPNRSQTWSTKSACRRSRRTTWRRTGFCWRRRGGGKVGLAVVLRTVLALTPTNDTRLFKSFWRKPRGTCHSSVGKSRRSSLISSARKPPRLRLRLRRKTD